MLGVFLLLNIFAFSLSKAVDAEKNLHSLVAQKSSYSIFLKLQEIPLLLINGSHSAIHFQPHNYQWRLLSLSQSNRPDLEHECSAQQPGPAPSFPQLRKNYCHKTAYCCRLQLYFHLQEVSKDTAFLVYVLPIITECCVFPLSASEHEGKLDRYRKIIIFISYTRFSSYCPTAPARLQWLAQ